MPQFTFEEIKALHGQAQSEGKLLGQMDLKGFASHMQQVDPENDWSQGQLPDNMVTSISRGIDKGFQATGLPDATASVGGSFGGLIDAVRGNPDTKYTDIGSSVGRGIPRAAAGVGLAIAGTAAAPVTGGGSLAAYAPAAGLIGLGAGDAAIKAYSDSGSVGAGAIAGATAGLAPGISSVGTKLGLGALGRMAPAVASNPVAKFVAAEIGQEAAFFGASAAGTVAQGDNPFTPENLFGQAVGTAAFAPLTVARGIGAAREKAPVVPEPKVPSGEIIPAETKIGGGKGVQDVPVNDSIRLFDFVTGKNDDELKKAYEGGNLKGALELTGLVDPDISTALETSNRRYKGRKMVSVLAEQNDTASWEANDRLFKKAATLLQTPEVEVRNMVQMVAAVNAFERKFKAEGPTGFLVNRPQLSDQIAMEQFNQRMADGTQAAMAENKLFDNAQVSAENRAAFEALPNKRLREQQAEAAKYGNPENNLTDENLTDPTVIPGQEELLGQQPARVRGRVNPNSLQERLSRPEWSKIGPLDENGEITATSLESTFQRNLDLEGDPDLAMARTDAQVRGALKGKLKDTRPDVFVRDGLDITSRAFDEMGIDGNLKDAWLGAVYRLLSSMNVFRSTRVRTLDEMIGEGLVTAEEARGAYGVYLRGEGQIGMSGTHKKSTPVLSAFHFVKTLAHEAFHALTEKVEAGGFFGLDQDRVSALTGARTYADSLDVPTRESLMVQLYSAVLPKELYKDFDSFGSARYAASSSEEFLTEYSAVMALSMTNKASAIGVQTHLRWAPQVIQDFAKAIFRTMDELKTMTLRGAEWLGLGKAQVQGLNQFQENLKFLLTPDPETVRARQEVQNALQPFDVLNGKIGPKEAQWSKVDSPALNEETAKYRTANLFERRFGTLQQHTNSMRVKELIPNASRVIGALTHLGADITKSLNVMRSGLLVKGDGGLLHELATTPDKSLTPEQIALKSNFGKVENSMENRVLLSRVYLRLNELTRDTNDNITFDYPELAKIWSSAKPEDQAAMRAVFDAQLEVNRNAAGLVKSAFLDRTKLDIARIYKGAGLFEDDAMLSAGVLLNHLVQGKLPPAELNQVAGTDNAVNFWNDVRPSFEDLASTLDRPHASELRTGRWQIAYTTADGLDGRVAANNKQELAAMQRELVKQGNTLKGSPIDNQNKEFNEFDAVPTAMAESLVRLEQARFNSALKNLADIMPDAAEKFRSDYTLGQAISEEANKRKQFLAERKYSAGREFIDMYSNQGAYAEVVAASVTKKLARNRIAWELESSNWDHDPVLKKEVETFAHDILSTRNTSALTQNIKKATMAVTMGANVSGAVIDSIQALMVGVWRIAETMGVLNAIKAVTKGYSEAFNPKNKEFQEILVRATNDGLLQSGSSFNDIFTIDDVAGYNVARSGDRRNLATLGDHLTDREFMAGKVFDMVKEYGGKSFNGIMVPTKASGQLNNKVMLYAGMVEGQRLGLKGEELYRHATHVSQVTNFQGGRGAQSSFKTKFGQANNWVEIATLLTNYPISVISQMYGNYRSMLKSSGLPADKRRRAAEVFAGQLTLQFGMAGSLGLGLGTLFKLTEQVFGFSPEEEVRKGLAEIDASGNLADVLLTGLANKSTGVDFASRFSLGGVMGLNDYTGFDAKGLFGPSTTLWGGIASLPKDLMEGRLDKSLLMPNGVRKMMEAASGEPIKDRNGQTLIEPTTTERIAKFIGFNSDRLAKVRKQRELYKFADEATQRENQLKTADRIELMQKGDFDSVLAGIQADLAPEIAQWRAEGISPMVLKKKIEKETREEALKLVSAAVQKSAPLDPLSSGNAASSSRRRQIAATFGEGLAPREVSAQQQALGARLLAGLGQAAIKRSPRSVRITKLVDQLIQNDPTLTEQEAQFIAEDQIK